MKPSCILISVVAIFFLGCDATPRATAEEIAAADIGPRISEAQSELLIRSWFNQSLKDPSSAQYQFSPIRKSYYVEKSHGTPIFAWGRPASVNAKNSFGGYVGARMYMFFFRDGNLVRVYTPEGRSI